MKFVKRQFAKIIDKFWRPKPFLDDDMIFAMEDAWLTELIQKNEELREKRIKLLTEERDINIKKKKKHSHIQREIEALVRDKMINEEKRLP